MSTADEFRQSVTDSIDPVTSLQIEFDLEAAVEAKAFIRSRPHNTAEWVRFMREHEPFFGDALTNVEMGLEGITPLPGRAVLVLSCPQARTDKDGDRFAMYATDLPADRASACGADSPCHRCYSTWLVSGPDFEVKDATAIIHVATGKYVVEFALCADCIGLYESMAESIRIVAQDGSTYIEFYDE